MKILRNSNVLIISHFYKRALSGGGPPQEIRDYFLPIVDTISYIEHPFPYADDGRSSLTIYKQGKIQKQIFAPALRGPDLLFYIFDPIFTFYFFLRASFKYDFCVALDNLNTVSVLPFRKIGIVKKLVFYTIDYNPKRFENKALNNIYHFLDRTACYYSDAIWVLSKKMNSERVKNKADVKRMKPSILLPMGANLERIKALPFGKINRHNLIYVGYLKEKQGVQIVLQALPQIIEKVPDVKFIIIGQGEYKNKLEVLAKKLKVKKYVEFKGFVKNHRQVEKILCKSALAIAPYVDSPDNYTRYTDPGKPKLYLGCGLPVIITPVPAIAKEISDKKAGVIVDYNQESIGKAIISLLSDKNKYLKYRKNALSLSKNYNTNTLISKAIRET